MAKYSDSILEMLKKDEGFVGQDPETLKKAHPKTAGTHGAYYDDKGYLTTGYGSLISKNKKGSKEELADIEEWKARTKYDPFNLTDAQASEILPQDIERVTAKAKAQLGDVDFDTLPEPCQQAVVSLAYNTGHIGNNTAAAIRKAATTKSTKDWKKCADMFANWHGNKAKEQPTGVLERRKREARLVGSIEGLYLEGGDSITPTNYVERPQYDGEIEQTEQPLNQATQPLKQVVQPTVEYVDPSGKISQKPITAPVAASVAPLDNDLSNTPFANTAFDNKQAAFNQQQEAEMVESADNMNGADYLSAFYLNAGNAIMTENIIGSSARKLALDWNIDKTYKPGFDATKIPGFKDMVKDIPPEDLKEILDESMNQEHFAAKITSREIESQARMEMDQYMSTNPVAGFVGIGIASMADVTSLIPVSKIASVVGMARAAKTMPMWAKTIGAGISENVIQDLAQETLLINNSDLRKWNDGDLAYGMVFSAALGGVAGSFKYSKGLSNLDKLASKYQAEKSLAHMEAMIKKAKEDGYSPKKLRELDQIKLKIEQVLEIDNQRAMVLNGVAEYQDRIGKGLIDTKKLQLAKTQLKIHEDIDAQIAIEKAKPNPIELAIQETKAAAKLRKAEISAPLVKLREENTTISKQINSLKNQVAVAGPKSKAQKKLDNLLKKRELNNTKINEITDVLHRDAKLAKGDKNRAVKAAQRAADPRLEAVKYLEDSKQAYLDLAKEEFEEFNTKVINREHPEQDVLRDFVVMNDIAGTLGLKDLKFKSVDDIDRFLGLSFDGSKVDDALVDDEYYGPARSAGSAAKQYTGFRRNGDLYTHQNKLDPATFSVLENSLIEAHANPARGLTVHQVDKNSVMAGIIRRTKLNEILTTDGQIGQFIINKNSLRHDSNEAISGLYNILSPDGMGREGAGNFSLFEKKQHLQDVYGGALLTSVHKALKTIKEEISVNQELRLDMGLDKSSKVAYWQMKDAHFDEKVFDNIIGMEIENPGMTRKLYGEKAGKAAEDAVASWKKVGDDVLNHQKEVGVKHVDAIEAHDKAYVMRSWDNEAARRLYDQYGENVFIQLVDESMRKEILDVGIEITEEIEKQLKEASRKMAYGLINNDITVNKAASIENIQFLRELIDKNLEGLDKDVLGKQLTNAEELAEAMAKKELGKRKQLSLNGSITLGNGTTLHMKDLLHKNIVRTQIEAINSASARIAAAEAGIKDVDELDKIVEVAYEIEMGRGNKEKADYIKKAGEQDVAAFKGGGVEHDITQSTNKLLRMVKKYLYAAKMQYTGISSIAEIGTLIPEAGYKAISQNVGTKISAHFKAKLLGDSTDLDMLNELEDSISAISGVGIEYQNFDSLVSSSRMITTSKYGQKFEKFVDNAGKATRNTSSWIETAGRKMCANSLALNIADIAMDRAKADSLLGGLSNRNKVELGLATYDKYTKELKPTQDWLDIVEAIKTHAVDGNKTNAHTSGGRVKDFQLNKWDVKTKRTFGKVIAQQTNHIFVNADSTTAQAWTAHPIGAIYNQFKAFANNAASKVAGHNLNQAIQGYKMGSLAESSKTIQKMFWSAALGKLSIMLYGAIDNAGREDFSERMEKYMHMDSPRDWLSALGRSSSLAGLTGPIDTSLGVMGQEQLFTHSTVGQSRNALEITNTPAGKLATDTAAAGQHFVNGLRGERGEFTKAGQKAIKASVIRKQLGVNQVINSLDID